MLNESIKTINSEKTALKEELEVAKKDCQIVRNQSTAQMEKAKVLVEKYKSIAKTAVDRYIDLQANRCGISCASIKQRLGENYSFNDIDNICEELQDYRLKVNALPFAIDNPQNKTKTSVKMALKESKKVTLPGTIEDSSQSGMIDDDIDDSLMRIIN